MATQFFSHQSPTPNTHYQPSPSPTQKRKRSASSAFTTTEPNSPVREPIVSGRTLKRTRARPNEELVHQYTLQKLFAAAKSTPPAQKQPQQSQQQKDFFSQFRSRASAPVEPAEPAGLKCEDCDREISNQVPEDEARCLGCHRVVCDFGCSASNGEGRVCLECVRYQ
jgi:hypothetical protein